MKKLLTIALLLVCCSPAAEKGQPSAAQTTQRLPSVTPQFGFPLTIHQPKGSVALLPQSPRRILPGSSGIVDMLSLILEAEQIVALPLGSDEYSRLRNLGNTPWALLPVFKRYSAEEILVLEPDLVLTTDWQNPESNAILAENGVPVVSLAQPESWSEVLAELKLLGRLCAREARAEEVCEQLESRREALSRDTLFGRGLRVLAYSNFGSGGFTSGSDTSMDLVLSLAGFSNAAKQAGLRGDCAIDFEQLLTIDADVLLVSCGPDNHSPSADLLLSRPELAGLKALTSRQPARLHRALFWATTSELIDAAESLQVEIKKLIDSVQ